MDNRNPLTNWAAFVLAVFSAYWGYLQYAPALSSARPEGGAVKEAALIGDQFVPGRLWQDPFDATRSHLSKEDPRQRPEELARQVKDWATNVAKCHVVGVFLEGQSYPEDVEVRLRLRYAMQSALADAGYRPADRTYLGLTGIEWPPGHEFATNYPGLLSRPESVQAPASKAAQKSDRRGSKAGEAIKQGHDNLAIPFEWFLLEGSTQPAHPVLVLWLQEEAFSDLPLHRLSYLLKRLFAGAGSQIAAVSVVGPRASDTLKGFLNESIEKVFKHDLTEFPKPVRIYSCQATAPDAMLLPRHPSTGFGSQSRPLLIGAIHVLNPTSVNLHNSIHTDDLLAASLLIELKNRGIRLTSGTNQAPADMVVLVSESDTTYGRSLLTTFSAGFTAEAEGKAMDQVLQSVFQHPEPRRRMAKNVIPITYLRGLDGSKVQTTGRESARKDVDKGDAKWVKPKSGTAEKAEGDAQIDYARRLAQHLKDLNDYELSSGGRGVQAIGILGSDVYDKLILLQALREQLGRALYFTTDMDARLLDGTEIEWTRNLIVASSHGLMASPTKPPFRDAYQTSIYRATLAALKQSEAIAEPEVPTLLEIGRTHAVELLPDVGVVTRATQPVSFRWLAMRSVGWLMAGVGLMILFSMLRSPARFYWKSLGRPLEKDAGAQAVQAQSQQQPDWPLVELRRQVAGRKRVWLMRVGGFGLGMVGVVLAAAMIDHRRPGGEPFYCFEGVSVWPTELLRALSIALSVWFLTWAWWTYRLRLLDAHRDYKMSPEALLPEYSAPSGATAPAGPVPVGLSPVRRWLEMRRRCSITEWHRDGSDKVDIEQLFRRYQELGRLRCRMCRVIPVAVGIGLLCFGVLVGLNDRPESPARGSWARACDGFLLISSIAAFALLMSYIMDITRLTERIVKRLGDGASAWPAKFEEHWKTKTGLAGKDLNGYHDVRFVAEHTHHVNRVVYLPFVILCLMLVSRGQYFDRWSWPHGLRFVFLLNFMLTMVCMWCVRRVAAQVRQTAIDDLEATQMQNADKPQYQKQLAELVAQIRSVRTGAYTSWLHDPSVVGILIPTGGAGLFALIRFLLGY